MGAGLNGTLTGAWAKRVPPEEPPRRDPLILASEIRSVTKGLEGTTD